MRREILINSTPREERVAILEDGELVELLHERPDDGRLVGRIYNGVVTGIVPGLQAAFVDIGKEKAAFLHASDLALDAHDEAGAGANSSGPKNSGRPRGLRGRSRSEAPKIQDALQKGQAIPVQITKDAIGTKGPRATAQVSIAGRYLVYLPGSSGAGISRKITDRDTRHRLRDMARDVVKGHDAGVIVRTVGEDLSSATLAREFEVLAGTWKKIRRRIKGTKPPSLLHEELGLTLRLIRDLFNDRLESCTIDAKPLYNEVRSWVGRTAPNLLSRVKLFREKGPIFDHFGIETELRKAMQREVPLPSGGGIVIEQTEALVSIDVNTGKFKGRRNPAETVFQTNMDAARVIARQLRLRDVGGIVVVDFIDMNDEASRTKVVNQMKSCLGNDRARTKVFEISKLGLLELSRQRISPSLQQRMHDDCPCCEGQGSILAAESVVRRVERALGRVVYGGSERGITIVAHPIVILHLLEHEIDFLDAQRRSTGLALESDDNPLLGFDEFRLLSQPAGQDVTDKYVSG